MEEKGFAIELHFPVGRTSGKRRNGGKKVITKEYQSENDRSGEKSNGEPMRFTPSHHHYHRVWRPFLATISAL